jgi:hypothetical protein
MADTPLVLVPIKPIGAPVRIADSEPRPQEAIPTIFYGRKAILPDALH